MLRKIRGVKNQRPSANFGPIAGKLNQHGLIGHESMLNKFPSDRTKISGVSLILDTAIQSRLNTAALQNFELHVHLYVRQQNTIKNYKPNTIFDWFSQKVKVKTLM